MGLECMQITLNLPPRNCRTTSHSQYRDLLFTCRNHYWHDQLPTASLGQGGGAPMSKVAPRKGELIYRPDGPLSRPNAGGYSLRDALDWDSSLYREVQVQNGVCKWKQMLIQALFQLAVHSLCNQHLQPYVSYKSQTAEARAKFRDAVCTLRLNNQWESWAFCALLGQGSLSNPCQVCIRMACRGFGNNLPQKHWITIPPERTPER